MTDPNKPKTAKEFIERGRAAGHDALGLMHDDEFAGILERAILRSAIRENIEKVIDLIGKLDRGCSCDVDHRCGNCDTILELKGLAEEK